MSALSFEQMLKVVQFGSQEIRRSASGWVFGTEFRGLIDNREVTVDIAGFPTFVQIEMLLDSRIGEKVRRTGSSIPDLLVTPMLSSPWFHLGIEDLCTDFCCAFKGGE